jgi:putative methionine-R-sulfoxide reductase with GAF domain
VWLRRPGAWPDEGSSVGQAEDRLALRRLEAATVDGSLQRGLDTTLPGGQQRLVDLDRHHGQSGPCEHLGDAPTHRAQADHPGGVNSHEASVSHSKMIYLPTMIWGRDSDQRTTAEGDVLAIADALEARSDDVALAMHELAQLLVAEEGVESTLQRISELAARVIPDCDAAGVTLYVDGKYVTAACTDQRTLEVDEGQYSRDEGPCLQAMRDKTVLRLDVAEANERWPEFLEDARRSDIHSFLAAPMLLKNEAIGSLNLYSSKASGFTELDDLLIALFTGQAAIAVANAKTYADAVELTRQLREAIDSRAVIEQAKGILMGREGIDAEAAFGRLRSWSQSRNIKLREIARQVVESTQTP